MPCSGLGIMFVGVADLSVSLGVLFKNDAPIVRKKVDQVVAAGSDADVPLGRITTDGEAIKGAVNNGYSVLRVGMDLSAIHKTFYALLDDFNRS